MRRHAGHQVSEIEKSSSLDGVLLQLEPHDIGAHSVLARVDGQVVVDWAVRGDHHSVRSHGVARLGRHAVTVNVRHLRHLVDLHEPKTTGLRTKVPVAGVCSYFGAQ